ncbi:hypothetical protein LOTGIDRAFT_156458 [Lottia gigantea]|uniref:SAM domain-containing protein n=1 Tax=Lottia gigantea TaxID=225164 RepID=V4B0U0_LOTGI|nr:hypothetical protein LOTGIDRAFT_156458 [Lottia gigantea]ESP03858.1 hypothetical protein LOTGIDRAFT_156458 [Lottia gigantea]
MTCQEWLLRQFNGESCSREEGYIGQSILNVNTNSTCNSLLMLNGHRSPSSPHNLPSPTSPNHWIQNTHNVYSPLMVVAPVTSCSAALQSTPLNIMSQCPASVIPSTNNLAAVNGYQNDYPPSSDFISVIPQHQHQQHQNIHQHQNIQQQQTSCFNQASSCNNSDSTNSPHQTPTSSSSPINLGSPCHPDLSGIQTASSAIGGILKRDTPLSSSGHTLDLLGLSKTTALPPLTKSQSMFLDRHIGNGDQSDVSLTNSNSSDILAPGIERKSSMSSIYSAMAYSSPFDYEEKKLMALKAIRKKPEGESRHPTDAWSGMGFSKSMPESAIRERMGQIGISSKCDSTMAAFQSPGNDISEGIDLDRDPWRDQIVPVNAPLNKAPGEYPSPRKKYVIIFRIFICILDEFGLSNSNHVDSAILPCKNWSHKTDLAELFTTMGLGKYTDLFSQQEIDISTFTTLTDQDLRELGISTFGARRKMLLAIADMNKRKTLRNVNIPSNSSSTPYTTADSSDQNNMIQRSRSDFPSLSGRW